MLNQRVLNKLGTSLSKDEIVGVTNCQYHMIETILFKIKKAIDNFNKNPQKDLSAAKAREHSKNLANKTPRDHSQKKRNQSQNQKSPSKSVKNPSESQPAPTNASDGSNPRVEDTDVQMFQKKLQQLDNKIQGKQSPSSASSNNISPELLKRYPQTHLNSQNHNPSP